MKPKVFYFANATASRRWGQQVRLFIEECLEGILRFKSPFYDRDGTPTEEIALLDQGITPTTVSKYDIVGRDLEMMRECDGVVAFITPQCSWGTIQETCIAYREFNLPVYLIFDEANRGKCTKCNGFNPNDPSHYWPNVHSTRVFESVKAFIIFAKEEWGDA